MITHFHYTEWPDHGVPDSSKVFLDLLEKVNKANTKNTPIVVHCSAGVGRSGTFLALHSLIEQIKQCKDLANLKFNLVNLVLSLREHRFSLVQSVEQYRFLYDCLIDYLKSILKPEEGKDLLL